METLEQLYENWRILAEKFEASIPQGHNAQLEWQMDQAFMKYIKAAQRVGIKVDMAAARQCVDRRAK